MLKVQKFTTSYIPKNPQTSKLKQLYTDLSSQRRHTYLSRWEGLQGERLEGGSLLLVGAQEAHSGTYSCVASNVANTSRLPVKIHVAGETSNHPSYLPHLFIAASTLAFCSIYYLSPPLFNFCFICSNLPSQPTFNPSSIFQFSAYLF